MSALDESLYEDENAPPEDGELRKLTKLAEQMVELDGEIGKLDASKAALLAKRNEIAERLLPEALQNAKMKSFELEDGRKIVVKDDLTISVPKVRMAAICDKLREWKNGDMIQNVITVDIPKGKDNEVARLQDLAAEIGLPTEREEKVNAGSLKALLKRKREAGDAVDLPFFGAFSLTRAEIIEK